MLPYLDFSNNWRDKTNKLLSAIKLPVEWVILHAQVISGEIARWVAQVVILVP